MSYMTAIPDAIVSAASDFENIGSSISEANAAAVAPTAAVLSAGADEVSATTAALFADYGRAYQAVGARGPRFISSSCKA